MSKSILDDLLVDKKSEKTSVSENQILAPLLDEINVISDDGIRSFIRSLLIKAENFWDIPSSFSGKYHPADEHGPGGNVLHTKRVVRITLILSESYNLSVEEKDIVVAAALIHDLCKGKKDHGSDTVSYDPMHPYAVGKFVSKCQLHDKKFSSETDSSTLYIPEDLVQSILRLVRCHLGPWSPVPETYPITYLDFIVHIADSIASKLHSVIMDSDLINPKWRINGPGDKTQEKI
jgi:HD superfamily phosphohydrolase YqeK